MSTPRKEESNETSDPVLQNSGEVSQVVEEKKEISLQDVLNVINAKFDQVDAKFDQVNSRLTGMEDRMDALEARWSLEPNKEVLALPTAKPEEGARTSLFGDVEDSLAVLPQKTPLAVQEALMFPSRSRAPGQELKTAVSGVEVAKRTSSFEGSIPSEEERSQVETRSDDEDSQTLPTARIKLSPSLGHEIRVSHNEGDNLVVFNFNANQEHESDGDPVLMKKPKPPDIREVAEPLFVTLKEVQKPPPQLADEREDSVQAHSLDVHEGNDDPALMKKPKPPDIKKVMERRLGQQETKSPPRRLVRRESLQGKWGERKR